MGKLEFCNNLLQDLKSKIETGTQYSLISASGLLRQLICDSIPVIPQAEKESGKTFNFWINFPNFEQSDRRTQDIIEKHTGNDNYQSVHLALSLDMGNQLYPIQLDEYRKMTVVSINKEYFTVEDIIEYAANKRGGIHLDEENLSEKQQRLHELSKILSIQEQESLITQIGYIAANVLLSAAISGFYSGTEMTGKTANTNVELNDTTTKEEIASWVYYALFLQKSEKYSAAREIFNTLLKHASEQNDKELEAKVFSYLARLFYDQKNYKISSHYYDKTITLCIEQGDDEGKALGYAQKGHVYVRLGDKEQALSLYNTAYDLLEELSLSHYSKQVRSFIEDLK